MPFACNVNIFERRSKIWFRSQMCWSTWKKVKVCLGIKNFKFSSSKSSQKCVLWKKKGASFKILYTMINLCLIPFSWALWGTCGMLLLCWVCLCSGCALLEHCCAVTFASKLSGQDRMTQALETRGVREASRISFTAQVPSGSDHQAADLPAPSGDTNGRKSWSPDASHPKQDVPQSPSSVGANSTLQLFGWKPWRVLDPCLSLLALV